LNSTPFLRLKNFYNDREYFQLLVKFTLPIALQNLVMASLNMVASLMIGQLGETPVAAVGQANQILFLLNLVVFGVVSGAAMFMAQLWGKRDILNIRRVIGLTVKLSLFAALVFWGVATFLPEAVMRLYSEDLAVIEIGSQYLRIVSWGYVFLAITAAYSVALRSTGNVRLPLFVSTTALGFNIFLSFLLIFGWDWIGLPALGTQGAALATVIARALECLAMLGLVYRDRTNPIAASWLDLLYFDRSFLKATLKPVLPVIANEILWSFGITTYNAIYGHIGTGDVAAINIVASIDQIAFVLFTGLGTATAIMVGNAIGQGEPDKAFTYAGRSIILQAVGGMVMGVLVYFFAGVVFQFYKVAPQVIMDARNILTVLSLGMWIRAVNHVVIIGVLRAGGDTRFSLVLDGLVIWLVGVPITAAGAILFGWPIHLVYALTFSEELTKMVFGTWRYFSRKWIHDLTGGVLENPL
jgi:putative MATE family efflux protein